MSFENPQSQSDVQKKENENKEGGYIDSPEMLEIKEKYKPIIDDRDKHYQEMVRQYPDRKGMKDALDVHNDIVLGYAIELIDLDKGLSDKERAASVLGTILHDGGKLDLPGKDVNQHHETSVKDADKLLENYRGKMINGVEIDDEIIQLTKDAIYRHMNHPYLVKMFGEFPEPKTKTDKIVHNADMFANIGFKNFAFRFFTEIDIKSDFENAEKMGITHLESALRNVIFDTMIKFEDMRVNKDDDGNIDDHGLKIRKMRENNVNNIEGIFNKMKEVGIFEKIHQELGVEKITMAQRSQAIARLNEEIIKAGQDLRLDRITLQNYKI